MNRSARAADVLDRIVATKRDEVARLGPVRAELRRRAESAGPARAFGAALDARGEVTLIAEYKRRSPSAGVLGTGDPAEVARRYAESGAAALSVLTDVEYFGGSVEDLVAARAAVELPVLRKDFVVDDLQVWEARAAGADAILLIVRILSDGALRGLLDLARELGMASLVEVHDAGELERAVVAGARIVGVNNRDLATFRTDVGVSLALIDSIPRDCVAVAESGIRTGEDVARLGAAGFDGVLVGETLMRAGGAEAVRALCGHAKRDRDARPAEWRASRC